MVENDDSTGTTEDGLQQFLAAGSVDMRLQDGRVRLIFTSLPARLACVAARDANGVLWIACDDGEPWVRGQVAELLADADGILGPSDVEGYGDRVVTALRRIPTRGTRGRCRLALLR